MFPSLIYSLTFPTVALAGVQERWWNVTYVQNANPDGLFPRRVIGINDTWPYAFRAILSSPDLTWHIPQSTSALRQHLRLSPPSRDQLSRRTNHPPPSWYVLQLHKLDGRRRPRLSVVCFILYLPVTLTLLFRSGIPPDQTFDYLVPINSSGQHGTFWAHAHANVRPFLS